MRWPGRRADLRQPGGRGRVAVDGQCRRADGLGERADRSAWLDQLSAGRAVVAVCRDGVLPVIPAGLPGAAQGWALAALAAGLIVAGRCTAWPARARPGRICMAMRPASTPSPWAAALPCWRGAAGSPSWTSGRARDHRRGHGGAVPGLAHRPEQCAGHDRDGVRHGLLLLGGATASRAHARPLRALAACGRLSYEIYLFHLVVLGLIRGWAAGAGVGRRAGRVAGGLSGGVLRGRLAGGAVVVGAGQRRAASAH